MPRRRGPRKPQRPVDRRGKKSSGSIKRWNARDDIEFDEVDRFHEQRDKILLEGEEDEPDSDVEDEEVFELKGVELSSDGDEDDGDENEDEDEEGDVGEEDEQDEKERAILNVNLSQKKEFGALERTAKKAKTNASSEDEGEGDGEEEEESWGTKKSTYYASNAALVDSDDEEAREMEEKEARRLQAKLRESLQEEDFGLIDALEHATVVDTSMDDEFWKPVEKLPATDLGSNKAPNLQHLEKHSPESLALAYEWDDVRRSITRTEKKLNEIESSDPSDRGLGLLHIYHQTQLSYAAVLASYFHLHASKKYSVKPELLRQHPILKRLLTLKQSLLTLEDLQFNSSDAEDEDEGNDDFESAEDGSFSSLNVLDSWPASNNIGLDAGELQALLDEAVMPSNKNNKRGSKRNMKAKLHATPSLKSASSMSKTMKSQLPPKKKQKVNNKEALPEVTFDVQEPTLAKKSSTSTLNTRLNGIAEAFGEATVLDSADAEDKSVRRKALRFHTAKIESAYARRANARLLLGGDDDIPYRKRKKEAEKKIKREKLGQGGDSLDDTEPDRQSRKRTREEDSEGGSGDENHEEDGYYSLVKRHKAEKKAARKAEHDTIVQAKRMLALEQDNVSTGQRSLTFAILKNKGLTPKRSKSIRNPRVKKRQKFEKAKRRLASQKPIYRGGMDVGRYGGEESGISKVVKSTKL